MPYFETARASTAVMKEIIQNVLKEKLEGKMYDKVSAHEGPRESGCNSLTI
jgi:hypothetical protein